jgi:group II intron reverse transcriptase/maturase
VSLETARRQKSGEQLELRLGERGEAPGNGLSGEAATAGDGDERSGNNDLMSRVVEHDNVLRAVKRVRQNGGSPGSDGMTVKELPAHLAANWEQLRAALLAGRYQPQPVRRQEIPKASGGVRILGIPSAIDRVIQQAILQVLQPRLDPSFSRHSHGYRPGHSAHAAVCEAQQYLQQGRRWVVDVDLEAFFDRVNHDVLMGKLAQRIGDKVLLGLIRRYLQAGSMADGVVVARHEGTPQGGPLSPLLANLLLDEVDKELEARGHTFVRYADDCNVYVRSRRAGEDVLQLLRRLYGRLRLRVNEAKSAVDRPWNRKFLGFSFWLAQGVAKRRVAGKSLHAMKDRVRKLTQRQRGRSLAQVVTELRAYLRGWKAYFRLAETPGIFQDLDQWLRHRLRALQLKHWKHGPNIYRRLRARGLDPEGAAQVASQCGRWWHGSRSAPLGRVLSNAYFDQLGVPRLAT